MAYPHGFFFLNIVFRILLFFVLRWAVEVIAVWLLNFLILEFSLWIYIDEDGIALFRNMLQIVIFVAYAVVQGPDCYRFCRSRGKVPVILILFNAYWDFAQDEILQPFWNKIADAAEKMQAGLDTKRERGRGTGRVCTRQEGLWWFSGDDAQGKKAGWKTAAMRTDSRGPTSLFYDVHVVSDFAMLGWFAVVFYTSVLGYDKSIVIK